MYIVSFKNAPKNLALPFEVVERFFVADLERALAIASMLQKISTPEVPFGSIIVEPFNKEEYETEKN